MNFFKKITNRFENVMIAVTFAEAGEFETAKKSMQEEIRQSKTISKKRRKTLRPVSDLRSN